MTIISALVLEALYGDGKNVRDWLYVEDHCKAIDLVLRKGREGEVYNVGGHKEKENIEIVKLTIATIHRMMTETPEYRHLLHFPPMLDFPDKLLSNKCRMMKSCHFTV